MMPERLREARKRAGFTLERLADQVGLSISQLSRFESGDRVPRVPELERIARILGVTVNELRGEAAPVPLEQYGLSESQARAVRLVVQAFLRYALADPTLRERLQDEAYQAAVARIISEYAKSRKVHEVAARDDDESALTAIQLALEFQRAQ